MDLALVPTNSLPKKSIKHKDIFSHIIHKSELPYKVQLFHKYPKNRYFGNFFIQIKFFTFLDRWIQCVYVSSYIHLFIFVLLLLLIDFTA